MQLGGYENEKEKNNTKKNRMTDKGSWYLPLVVKFKSKQTSIEGTRATVSQPLEHQRKY